MTLIQFGDSQKRKEGQSHGNNNNNVIPRPVLIRYLILNGTTFRDLSLGDIGLRGMDETMPEMSSSVCWTLFVGHRQWQTQERAV